MGKRNTAAKLNTGSETWATSKDGYRFDVSANSWKLNKDVTVTLGLASDLPEPTQQGFRFTLQRYAEEMSARHTENMATRFQRYLRDTKANAITSQELLNWRAMLGENDQWHLGGLKGFLLAWHEYGFRGVGSEVVDLLEGWTIKGNLKGVAVLSGCPWSGPYTDLEVAAILDWANRAVVKNEIDFNAYAFLLSLIMMARRPVQIAALRGKDLIKKDAQGGVIYKVNVPRAKQRGGGFRLSFRALSVIEDVFLVLERLHHESVKLLESHIGEEVPADLKPEVPIFLNANAAKRITNVTLLRNTLLGSTPDILHKTTSELSVSLRACGRLSTARSERTGEYIHLSATRFRHTRGTKLRREGFGPFIIAELLDHSDIQNVRVYTENTAQEAIIINELIGAQLAPFAQACLGTLVTSEREAIRGSDPLSRVPNHQQKPVGNCGSFGFCASGYRACYTCHHFQPWVDGPHSEVLAELYSEKQRTKDAGCSQVVVDANDHLILAVEHCVSLCAAAKKELSSEISRVIEHE